MFAELTAITEARRDEFERRLSAELPLENKAFAALVIRALRGFVESRYPEIRDAIVALLTFAAAAPENDLVHHWMQWLEVANPVHLSLLQCLTTSDGQSFADTIERCAADYPNLQAAHCVDDLLGMRLIARRPGGSTPYEATRDGIAFMAAIGLNSAAHALCPGV